MRQIMKQVCFDVTIFLAFGGLFIAFVCFFPIAKSSEAFALLNNIQFMFQINEIHPCPKLLFLLFFLKVACPSFCLAVSCRLFPHEFFHVAPTLGDDEFFVRIILLEFFHVAPTLHDDEFFGGKLNFCQDFF